MGRSKRTKVPFQRQRHDAINLGQGFPDFDGPDFLKEAAVRAIRDGHNQYCRMTGVPELNRALCEGGVAVRALIPRRPTLEEYFRDQVGASRADEVSS